jgi:hypothetical protein
MHETWERMARNLHFTEAAPTMAEVGKLYNPTEIASGNWSGYLAQSPGKKYSQVTANLQVPSTRSEKLCPGASLSGWVGLGGSAGSSNLAQDGFQAKAGAKTYQVWWEVLPWSERIIRKVHATVGGQFLATTQAVGSHSRWFFVYDETTGEGHGFKDTTPNHVNDESVADVIPAERTTVEGTATPLLHFLGSAAAGWVNNNTLLENETLLDVKMHQHANGEGTELAAPGKTSSLTHEFADNWEHCGKRGY